MAAPDPMIKGMTPPPAVSCKSMHMAGLSVDVYGLDELPSPPATVSLLWLHHPRLRVKEDMADIAARCVSAWNDSPTSSSSPSSSSNISPSTPRKSHGLLALSFSQRNHGERLVRAGANESWGKGNATHAQDMFSIVTGTVADTRVLMDVAEAYLFPDGKTRAVQHLVLGVSLGGHSGWQLIFADERVTAGALVIGCPDFMALMSQRAKRSKLATADADSPLFSTDFSFLNSIDFPPSLVSACLKHDPRGIIFGTSPTQWDSSPELRSKLRERVGGKRFLVCSGRIDKLVPYSCGEPFLDFLRKAGDSWREIQLEVEDKVYSKCGHQFRKDMVEDAVRFVVDSVAIGAAGAKGKVWDERSARI